MHKKAPVMRKMAQVMHKIAQVMHKMAQAMYKMAQAMYKMARVRHKMAPVMNRMAKVIIKIMSPLPCLPELLEVSDLRIIAGICPKSNHQKQKVRNPQKSAPGKRLPYTRRCRIKVFQLQRQCPRKGVC